MELHIDMEIFRLLKYSVGSAVPSCMQNINKSNRSEAYAQDKILNKYRATSVEKTLVHKRPEN